MPLTFLVGFAGVFGASEGIRASQAKSRREEHRSRKNNLKIHCPKSSQYSPYLEGRNVVLSGNKLYVDTGTAHDIPFGHPFEGYYLPYPDSRFSGLVSSITDEAPIMNWIFVDRNTYQMRFGTRAVSDGNFTGPWDCTRQDRRLTFAGWEGFCAVLEEGGIWGLYFDRDGDSLRGKLGPGRAVIEVELLRKELKTRKPPMLTHTAPNPEQKQPHPDSRDTKTSDTSNPPPDEKRTQEEQPRVAKGDGEKGKPLASSEAEATNTVGVRGENALQEDIKSPRYKRPTVEDSEEE